MNVVGRCVCPQFSADPSSERGDRQLGQKVLASPVSFRRHASTPEL